jgi:hypothetical protein
MAAIKEGRQIGNTTRQIDQEVQDLFTQGAVVIHDHAQAPSNFAFDIHFEKLLLRLKNEHSITIGRGLEYDPQTKIISISK